jgi:hypothetical protein
MDVDRETSVRWREALFGGLSYASYVSYADVAGRKVLKSGRGPSSMKSHLRNQLRGSQNRTLSSDVKSRPATPSYARATSELRTATLDVDEQRTWCLGDDEPLMEAAVEPAGK